MSTVDELLSSLEALAREGSSKSDVRDSVSSASSLRFPPEETLQDYFSDELSSVRGGGGEESSRAAETEEAIAVERRRVRRLWDENLKLRKLLDKERSLRVAAEDRAKVREREREHAAKTVESLVLLLRDANETILELTKKVSALEEELEEDQSLPFSIPHDTTLPTSTGSDEDGLEGSKNNSNDLNVSIQDMKIQLEQKSRELERSEGKRRAAEMELAAMNSESRAAKILEQEIYSRSSQHS